MPKPENVLKSCITLLCKIGYALVSLRELGTRLFETAPNRNNSLFHTTYMKQDLLGSRIRTSIVAGRTFPSC